MSLVLNRWKSILANGGTPEPKNDSGEFVKGINRAWEGTKGMTKAAAGALMGGDEELLFAADMNQLEAQRYAPKVEGMTNIRSLSDAGDWLAGTAGESVVNLGTTLAGGGAGGLAGRGLARLAGESALRQMGRAGALSGITATAYPQQFGENVQAVRAEHGGQLPAGSTATMALTAVAQTALDTLPVMGVLDRFGVGDAARSGIMRQAFSNPARAKVFGQELGATALKEGVTEAIQESMKLSALEWIDSNKDHFDLAQVKQIVDAFGAGAVGGGVMGTLPAARSALSGILNKPAALPALSSKPDMPEASEPTLKPQRVLDLPQVTLPHPDDVYAINSTGEVAGFAPAIDAELRSGLWIDQDTKEPVKQRAITLPPDRPDPERSLAARLPDSVVAPTRILNRETGELEAFPAPKRRLQDIRPRVSSDLERSLGFDDFNTAVRQEGGGFRRANLSSMGLSADAGLNTAVPGDGFNAADFARRSVPYRLPDTDAGLRTNTEVSRPSNYRYGGVLDTDAGLRDAGEREPVDLMQQVQIAKPALAEPGFLPTHELSDGTAVVAHPEDAGVWVAKDGSEYEDRYAKPLADPSLVKHQKLIDKYQEDKAKIQIASSQAALSPLNELPEPTTAQKEAGNYKKGMVRLHGLPIAIEIPKGAERKGVDKEGKAWAQKMFAHYGYVRGSSGVDGDQVDVFLGDDAANPNLPVFVVDQIKPDGSFDEHKVMMGYPSLEAAKQGYLANYKSGWNGLGDVTPISLEDFKKIIKSGWVKKPFGKPIKNKENSHAIDESMESASNAYRDSQSDRLPKLEGKNVPSQPRNLEADSTATGNANRAILSPIQSAGKRDRPSDGRVGYDAGAKRDEPPDNNLIPAPSSAARRAGSNQRMAESTAGGSAISAQASATGNPESTRGSESSSTGQSNVDTGAIEGAGASSKFNSQLNPKLQFAHDALVPYGAALTDDGFVASGDKVTGVKAVIKDNRLRFELANGGLVSSGPLMPETVESFVEKYWFWKKQKPTIQAAEPNKPDVDSSVTYDEAIKKRAVLEAALTASKNKLTVFKNEKARELNIDSKSSMGLTPDTIKNNPAYSALKQDVDRAFQNLQTFNSEFVRKFKGEENRKYIDEASAENVKPVQKKQATKESNPPIESSFQQKLERQKQAESLPHVANDLNNIRATLPILLPEQQEDVKFAEERFSQSDKFGVLFTNGTGTGKTFTGLGMIKRFARQGHDNIIIITPSDKTGLDYVEAAKAFNLEVKQLKNTEDNGGSGIVVTTYANFGANPSLLNRQWDLIVPDESHRLNSSEAGDITRAQQMLDYISGLYASRGNTYWNRLIPDLAELKQLHKTYAKDGESFTHFTDYFSKPNFEDHGLEDTHPDVVRYNEIMKHAESRRDEIKARPRAKVVFLSATPFAYHKSLSYAEGYLFDAPRKQSTGYNEANGLDAVLESKFGYHMKTGKLNRPDASVDTSLAERNFNEELKKAGALLGRRLKVDADYSREFVLIDDAIGKKIDEGMRYLRDNHDQYPGLSGQFYDRFDHLSRLQLLEALKVKHAINRINKHLALGRKIVVFHTYKKGGSISHPFKFVPTDSVSQSVVDRFNQARSDLVNLPIENLPSPIEALKQAFGKQAVFFNGDIPKAERSNNVKAFNRDNSGVDIILVQREAGKEGISLHDTTNVHQRVLIDLGLPTKPTDAIQTEGRIYRTGVKSNAIIEYLTTGLDYENHAFANAVATRSSTAENLALGHEGRNLLRAFVDAYQNANEEAPSLKQGTGGKQGDRAGETVASLMDQAKLAYYTRQKNSKRRDQREGKDYYATPEPVGLKMAQWLMLKPNDHALEPSAGHGAIAKWFPNDTKNIFVEQSYSLAGELGMLGSGEVRNVDFMSFNPARHFDGVAMNPPYGHGGSDAITHMGRAFNMTRNGGRVIVLIPEGGATDTKVANWLEAQKDAQVIAEISLPNTTFKNAGTSVKTRILVIDKIPSAWTKKGVNIPFKRSLNFSHIEDLTELFDTLNDVAMPERVTEPTESTEQVDTTAVSNPPNVVKPKYRSLTNPDLTWTGRGRKPTWVDDHIVMGGTLEELLIDKDPQYSQPQRHTTPSTPRLVNQILTAKLGENRLASLLKQGKLIISEASPANGVQGKYENGVVTLYPANMEQGNEWGVFLHEAGEHAALAAMLGDKYQQVVASFDRLLNENNPDAVSASRRVPDDTPPEHVSSEQLAYLIEQFTNDQTKTGKAKALAQRLIASIRSWAFAKLPSWLTQYMKLTTSDIQALAQRSAKAWADGQVQSKAASQYSVANDSLWSDIDKDAPKQGIERTKELTGKAWQWAKDNAQEFVKTGGLAVVTLRQLADIGQQVVPAIGQYMSRVERMLTERNKMMDDAGKLSQRWMRLDKRTRHRLATLMHLATLAKVDPSLSKSPDARMKIRVADGEWRAKLGLPDRGALLTQLEPESLSVDAKIIDLLNKRRIEANKVAQKYKGSREKFELYNKVAQQTLEDWREAKRAHIRSQQAGAEFAKLRVLFQNLPESAQAIFTDSRDMYEARFKRKHDALVRSIKSSDMADDKKAALTRTLQHEFESAQTDGIYFPLHRQGSYFVRADKKKSSASEVLHFKRGTGTEKISRGTGEVSQESSAWDSPEAAMRSAQSRSDLIALDLEAVQHDGGWVLREKQTEPVFMMFPTAAEAERESSRLSEMDGYSAVKHGKLNKENTQDELSRAGVMMQTMAQMKKSGQDVPDALYQMMLEMLPELSMRKNSIHRKGVMGYSDDALQAFGHQMMHQAHQISKLEARDDLASLLDQVAEQSQLASNQDRMLSGNLREELKKRHDWVMNPKNATWTNWTSSFGFLMYLGVSPAAALVNLSQVAVVGYPVLAAEFGWKAAGKALMDASRLLSVKETLLGEDALKRSGMSADEIRAFEHWHDEGVIDKTQAQMLAGVADNDALSNSATYQKVMGLTTKLFHKAEVVNREVMLLAGYRLARNAGWSHDRAMQFASSATWESQFDYSNANRARLMQGDWAKILLMFKSYSQHMIYFMLKNANDWGKGGQDAKKAKAKLLGILGVTLAMGGVSALPIGFVGGATAFAYVNAKYGTKAAVVGMAGASLGLMVLAAAVFDDDEDWETETRKVLREMGGDALESLVFRGAVNAATGVDMSSRISLDDLLIRSQDRELEGADAKAALMESLTGPVIGYGVNAVTTVPELWSQGNEWRAVEKAVPKFARDVMQALRFGNEGALTMRGSPIVEKDLAGLPSSEELNLWNIFMKANGFGAEKLTRQYIQNNAFYNYKARAGRSRERALNRLFIAKMERDKDAEREAMAEISAWNKAHPKAKQLDAKAVGRSMKARMRARNENDRGVRVQKGYAYLREE
ncbi:PLxRFG domain-containing protein [Thiolinea disciformis]|uniref:PLxRFG domain-containing protein n=1 Tax=Thiolinea disciformis TaxID=125614 RepID=UPI00037B3516|nr:PLxRFG domain-containing protein [Thiolinea disciformis]